MISLQQRAQIEYDRRNGDPPALIEIHWDTFQQCPIMIEEGYVTSMNGSHTLRNFLSQNHIYIGQMDGVVFGEPCDGELLDCLVEHLPVCQLTIRAPFAPFANEYLYEPSMEAVMDEILDEIETARCTE